MKNRLFLIIFFYLISIQFVYAQNVVSLVDSLHSIASKLYAEKIDYETAASLETIALELLNSTNENTQKKNTILMGLAPCLEDLGQDENCKDSYLHVKTQLEADNNTNSIDYAYVLCKLSDIFMPDDMSTAKQYIDISKKIISEDVDFCKF